jgi:hypothetical protein
MSPATTLGEQLDHKRVLTELFSLSLKPTTIDLIHQKYKRPFQWQKYSEVLQEVCNTVLICKDEEAKKEAMAVAWAAAAARAMASYEQFKDKNYLNKALGAIEQARKCLQSSTQKQQSSSVKEEKTPLHLTHPIY